MTFDTKQNIPSKRNRRRNSTAQDDRERPARKHVRHDDGEEIESGDESIKFADEESTPPAASTLEPSPETPAVISGAPGTTTESLNNPQSSHAVGNVTGNDHSGRGNTSPTPMASTSSTLTSEHTMAASTSSLSTIPTFTAVSASNITATSSGIPQSTFEHSAPIPQTPILSAQAIADNIPSPHKTTAEPYISPYSRPARSFLPGAYPAYPLPDPSRLEPPDWPMPPQERFVDLHARMAVAHKWGPTFGGTAEVPLHIGGEVIEGVEHLPKF